jgi:hypothetical protein
MLVDWVNSSVGGVTDLDFLKMIDYLANCINSLNIVFIFVIFIDFIVTYSLLSLRFLILEGWYLNNVYDHFLLLFCKISIPIYALLPVLQDLKGSSVVEFHSSSSQPALHNFLDCHVSFVVITGDLFKGLNKW